MSAIFFFAKTPHKGVIRGNQLVKEDPTASCGCPDAVACPQTAHSRRKGHLKKKKRGKGKSVGCFLGLSFCSLCFCSFFWEAPWVGVVGYVTGGSMWYRCL
jgi:hypothetical protein